jgi:hypothetical protein|tara:strand:- start:301 stop:426 length:126 start_codon:yes stop_codon:yes gene_type:complete
MKTRIQDALAFAMLLATFYAFAMLDWPAVDSALIALLGGGQ